MSDDRPPPGSDLIGGGGFSDSSGSESSVLLTIRENDVLAEICRAIVRYSRTGQIIQEATERLQRYFGTASIGIWFQDHDDLVMEGLATTDQGQLVSDRVRRDYGRVPMSEDLPGARAMRERRTLRWTAHDPDLSPDIRQLLRAIDAAFLVAIPIFADGDPCGSALIGVPEGAPLSAADESLLDSALTVLGLLRDRASLQEREAEHERRALEAYHMAAMGELAAGLAHEVNNPLSAISQFAETLLMGTESEADERRALEAIRSEARRAGQIVRGLLTFARETPGEARAVSLEEEAMRVLQLMRHQLLLSDIHLEVESEEGTAPVLADPHHIHQVVHNLVVNARQAIESRRRGGRISVRIRPRGERVELVVEDTGPGLTPTAMEAMFTPFFTTRDPGTGTGLGLSLVYGLVRESGGDIRGENWGRPSGEGGGEDEGGARFVVALPSAPAEVEASEEPPPSDDGGEVSLRVLVVDDEPLVAAALERLLQRLGHRPEVAGSAEEALGRLEEDRAFDLILSDLRMPGMGGAGLYAALIERHPEMAERLAFVSGDIVSPGTREFVEDTDRPVLSKPYELGDLTRLLAEAATRRGSPADPPSNDG